MQKWLQYRVDNTTIVHIMANVFGYKFLRFWGNPQKYQTLVPAKNSHLKVSKMKGECTTLEKMLTFHIFLYLIVLWS